MNGRASKAVRPAAVVSEVILARSFGWRSAVAVVLVDRHGMGGVDKHSGW